MQETKCRPLDGIRVIEIGQLLAGPFAGCMLGYFGAEVIKIEPPEGDPIRGWRVLENGTSHWWRSIGRNKKSITLDLKKAEGQQIARQLIESADDKVLIQLELKSDKKIQLLLDLNFSNSAKNEIQLEGNAVSWEGNYKLIINYVIVSR